MLKRAAVVMIALTAAVGVRAALLLNTPGAVLALPVITANEAAGETITSIIVSNQMDEEYVLAINVISGDPEDRWASNSFFCLVSPREVTHFLFVPEGDSGSRVFFECSLPDASPFDIEALNQQRELPLIARNGIMFIALEQNFATVGDNALTGSATVVDFATASAFSVEAIPFQGFEPDDDRVYKFDGNEFAEFPALVSTTFHAPTIENHEEGVEGALILFTLDGTIGAWETPEISVHIDYFNDDELPRDAQVHFDCFTILGLEEIGNGNLIDENLGSPIGSLELTTRAKTQTNVAHDVEFGDGNRVRNVPIHGWLFQTLRQNGLIRQGLESEDPSGIRSAGPSGVGVSMWGRTLDQFGTHIPSGVDVPVLKAE